MSPRIRFLYCLLAFSVTRCSAQGADGPPVVEQLTIDKVVAEAMDHNLGLLAERYNLPIASAKVITARLRPNPVLTLDADHLPWAGTTFNAQNQAGPPEYSVRTDFLLERGHKRQNRITVAETARSVTELQLLDTLRSVILEAQNAFVETLQARASLALAHENEKALANLVEINSNRVRSGDLARVELTRVQLAQLQYLNAVRQAELKLATAQLHLLLVMGRTAMAASSRIDAEGSLKRTSVAGELNELSQEAQQRRPDLSALRQDQARSQADIRLQLAQGKVDYTVGTEYRRQQGVAGRGNSLGFFVQTNIPIFNRNQGEIERSHQEQLQLQSRLRAMGAGVESEVRGAFAQYTTAREALEKIESEMLGRAKDIRETTEYSYKRGEASLVELLDAQRAYNETMQTYNDAQADFARSLYTIDSVTGRSVTK